MKPTTKVRLTFLAGALVGILIVFMFLAGQDAQAPKPEFARLVDPTVRIDNNETPCLVPPPSRDCRAARKAGK